MNSYGVPPFRTTKNDPATRYACGTIQSGWCPSFIKGVCRGAAIGHRKTRVSKIWPILSKVWEGSGGRLIIFR